MFSPFHLANPARPLIKVCGTREVRNILEIDQLGIDYMGFIFFNKSPRNAQATSPLAFNIKTNAKRVGVFVNAKTTVIKSMALLWNLGHIQLHGDEPPEQAKILSQTFGMDVWKAFRITNDFDFELLKPYQEFVSAFVFDAPGHNYGGNGKQYDWQKLKEYEGRTPFWLSGGIGLRTLDSLKDFYHPACIGYDVNSKFEIVPGKKDPKLIADFIKEVRPDIVSKLIESTHNI